MSRSKLLLLTVGLAAIAVLVTLSRTVWRGALGPKAPATTALAPRPVEAATEVVPPPSPERPAREPAVAGAESTRASAGPGDADRGAPALRAIRVLVVDEAGEPVPGVPVHLVKQYSFLPGKYGDGFVANSGADGVAVLTELDRMLDLVFQSEEGTPYVPSRLGLRCGLSPGDPDDALDESWIVWLEQEPAPGAVVRVRCPALGWVKLSVAGEGASDVTAHHPLRATWVRRVDGFQSGTRGWKGLERAPGSVLLGPFPLGWELTLRLGLDGRAGQLGWMNIDGPSRVGEIVEVAFEIAPSRFIAGVALRPDRTPFGGERIFVHLGDPDLGGVPGANAVTDADGRWEIAAPVDLEIPMLAIEGQGQRPRSRGDVLLADPRPSAEDIDVGEVEIYPRLKPERLLVSGRVLDQGGAPLRNAWVHVYPLVDGVAGKGDLARDRTGRGGEYKLLSRAELETDRLSVVATHPEHLRAEPIEAVLGSVGVDFALERGGSLTGEVLVDPEAHPEQIVIRMRGPGRSNKLSLVEFQWRERGSFRGLEAGAYELRFEIRKTKWLLLEARGELSPGGELDLGPFDLRGKVKLLRLRLTDADGAPIAKEYFQLVDTEHVGYSSLRSEKDGSVLCLVPAETNSFLFGSQKYGAYTIQAGPDPIELVLYAAQ